MIMGGKEGRVKTREEEEGRVMTRGGEEVKGKM